MLPLKVVFAGQLFNKDLFHVNGVQLTAVPTAVLGGAAAVGGHFGRSSVAKTTVPFRHYTSLESLTAILRSGNLLESDMGTGGPGVYFTTRGYWKPTQTPDGETVNRLMGMDTLAQVLENNYYTGESSETVHMAGMGPLMGLAAPGKYKNAQYMIEIYLPLNGSWSFIDAQQKEAIGVDTQSLEWDRAERDAFEKAYKDCLRKHGRNIPPSAYSNCNEQGLKAIQVANRNADRIGQPLHEPTKTCQIVNPERAKGDKLIKVKHQHQCASGDKEQCYSNVWVLPRSRQENDHLLLARGTFPRTIALKNYAWRIYELKAGGRGAVTGTAGQLSGLTSEPINYVPLLSHNIRSFQRRSLHLNMRKLANDLSGGLSESLIGERLSGHRKYGSLDQHADRTLEHSLLIRPHFPGSHLHYNLVAKDFNLNRDFMGLQSQLRGKQSQLQHAWSRCQGNRQIIVPNLCMSPEQLNPQPTDLWAEQYDSDEKRRLNTRGELAEGRKKFLDTFEKAVSDQFGHVAGAAAGRLAQGAARVINFATGRGQQGRRPLTPRQRQQNLPRSSSSQMLRRSSSSQLFPPSSSRDGAPTPRNGTPRNRH